MVFDNLDIVSDLEYELTYQFNIAGNGAGIVGMHLNDDSTATNYYLQQFVSDGTANSGSRINNWNLGGTFNNVPCNITGKIFLFLHPDGKAVMMQMACDFAPASCRFINRFGKSVNSFANINKITFTCTTASGILTGSSAAVYRK